MGSLGRRRRASEPHPRAPFRGPPSELVELFLAATLTVRAATAGARENNANLPSIDVDILRIWNGTRRSVVETYKAIL